MILKNFYKIPKFKRQVTAICKEKGYTLLGDIRKTRLDDLHWTFAVRTPEKDFLVKLVVPYPLKMSTVNFLSTNEIFLEGAIPLLAGFRGMPTFPVYKQAVFEMEAEAFGIRADQAEKIYLVYPACESIHLGRKKKFWRIGFDLDGVKLYDGASFRALLKHPAAGSKFAAFES